MLNLSVVIPTLNRAASLKRTLNSIVDQTLPQTEFEVIVIDNGSIDETKKVVKKFSLKIKNLRYFYSKKPGLHVGRNLGFKKARSDILVYTDDDIEAFPEWLQQIYQTFKDKKVYLVGGKNLPKFEEKPPFWLKKIWIKKGIYGKAFPYLSILDFGNTTKEIDPYYVWGCNFSIRRSILLKTKGFHPDGMPDDLIRYRGDGETYVSKFIVDNKYKALYNPKACIFHIISKEKINIDYVCKKAFMAGVSISYSAIRYKNENLNMKDKSLIKKIKSIKGNLFIKINVIKSYFNINNGKSKATYKTKKNKIEIAEIKMRESFRQGYDFHQKMVLKDKLLLKWVLKDNYLK